MWAVGRLRCRDQADLDGQVTRRTRPHSAASVRKRECGTANGPKLKGLVRRGEAEARLYAAWQPAAGVSKAEVHEIRLIPLAMKLKTWASAQQVRMRA